MKNKSIEFGVFLLSIGVVFLLVNIGIINWSIIDGLFDLWPAIFIVMGINVIFKDNSVVRVITWLLFLAAVVSYGYFFEPGGPWIEKSGRTGDVSIEKAAETERGELKLALGGTKLVVDSTSSKLVDAAISDSNIKNIVSYKDEKKTAVVEFKSRNEVVVFPGKVRDNCQIGINDQITWNMDVDAGAVSGIIDMSNLKVEDMDIDVGAGKLKLIFGDKHTDTFVKVDSGASSIDVVVPKSAGVKVKIDGVLNNTNLKQLGWNKRGSYYISPNYDSSESKIDMDIDMGVGNFNIKVQ